MKKLGLILSLLIPSILLSQSSTYYPGGTINPPYNFKLQTTPAQPWANQVTIPLYTELAAVPNVANWGVKCDGVTDDTVALNVALAQSAYKPIVLPTGNCLISGPLFMQEGASLTGFGGSTILASGTGYSVFNMIGRFIHFSNFVMDCVTSCSGLTAFEVGSAHGILPQGGYVQDGLVISDVRLFHYDVSRTDQWSRGLIIHSGLAASCPVGVGVTTDCSSSGIILRSLSWRYCGACITIGDGTGTVPVIGTHITDINISQSTTPITLNAAQNLSTKGATFIGTTGTSLVISASSQNMNNVFLNPSFISPAGALDISIGAGAGSNIFLGAVLNHARISDAGTNTSFLSAVELTTGTSSIQNGHIGAIGAAPSIICSGGTYSAGAGSNDTAGTMITNGANTTCTTTFAIPYVNAPSCFFLPVTGGSGLTVTINNNNIVMNQVSGVWSFKYACLGH